MRLIQEIVMNSMSNPANAPGNRMPTGANCHRIYTLTAETEAFTPNPRPWEHSLYFFSLIS